jgi:intracellular septation protein A
MEMQKVKILSSAPAKMLVRLLPGFLPILVYILADSFLGEQPGLLIAIGFGVLEFIIAWTREKKPDLFVVLDTALLVVMGGISILLDNSLFFKLKPALIEAIFCVILAVSVFTPADILIRMTRRYMGGMEFGAAQRKALARGMKALFWMLLVHTALVTWSAFALSREAWGFISGILFYLMFAAYSLFELGRTLLTRHSGRETPPPANDKGADEADAAPH